MVMSGRSSRRDGSTGEAAEATRRGGGLKRLPSMLFRLLEPAARRRGLADASILRDWSVIVGAELAARAEPIKLSRHRGGGTLQVRVGGSAALELMHQERLVVERINDHFGFAAVGRLHLVQAAPRRTVSAPEEPSPELAPDVRARIASLVEPVQPATLRAALEALGRAVAKAERDERTST